MSYKNSGIQIAQGNLNSASINAMNTTAQTLISAPGAGLVIYVLGTFFNMKVGSTPWGAGDIGNVWLVYGTTANDQTNMASPFITNQIGTMSANTNYVFGNCSAIGSDVFGSTTGNITKVLSSNAINKPVSITCINAIAASGNGNMDWTIFYAVLKAS